MNMDHVGAIKAEGHRRALVHSRKELASVLRRQAFLSWCFLKFQVYAYVVPAH